MTRVVDKQRTKEARRRHEAGVKTLNKFFGFTRADHEALDSARRISQGHGPTSTVPMRHRPLAEGFHPTRASWTRSERRKAAKAQRLAQRKART